MLSFFTTNSLYPFNCMVLLDMGKALCATNVHDLLSSWDLMVAGFVFRRLSFEVTHPAIMYATLSMNKDLFNNIWIFFISFLPPKLFLNKGNGRVIYHFCIGINIKNFTFRIENNCLSLSRQFVQWISMASKLPLITIHLFLILLMASNTKPNGI